MCDRFHGSSILFIRGRQVILDQALARLYGVSVETLNRAVKRNSKRFPSEFMFRLTLEEARAALSLTRESLKSRPYAFTELGVLMLASVLRSSRAIQADIQSKLNLVQLRKMLGSELELDKRLNALKSEYDRQFKVLFDEIHQIRNPASPKRKQIGFIDRDD